MFMHICKYQAFDESDVNPYPAKLIYLLFHPLKAVSRWLKSKWLKLTQIDQTFTNLDVQTHSSFPISVI